MKLTRILIVAFGLMLLAAGTTFAQVTLVSSSTLNQMAPNAQTGLSGSVALTPLASGTIPAGESINVSFLPATISSLSDLVVTVAGCPTPFTGFTAYGIPVTPQTCGAATVTVTANQSNILIGIGGGALSAPAGGQLVLIQGARLDVSSFAAVGATLNAIISSNVGLATITNPAVPVAIFQEPITLTPATQTIGTASTLTTAGGTTTATVTITEAGSFTNAFETKGDSEQTQIKLVVTTPTGFTFNAATGASINSTSAGTTASIDAASAGNIVIVDIDSQNPNALDFIKVNLTFSATAPVSLTPANATVTATLFPPKSGNPPFKVGPDVTVGGVTTKGGRLLYADRPVPSPAAAIVFHVTPLETILLSVFNTTEGFETGIVVTNASGIMAPGLGQPGVIKVTLYPADGSAPKTFTTSGTAANRPGRGLSTTDGSLPIGGSWIVTLSQLLAPAGITGDFTGMVVFDCQFSGGEGVNYITDENFSTQAQGYPMVVVPWENFIRSGNFILGF